VFSDLGRSGPKGQISKLNGISSLLLVSTGFCYALAFRRMMMLKAAKAVDGQDEDSTVVA